MHCLWVSMPQFFCLSPLPQWIVKVDRAPILKRIPWSCNWKGQGGFGINQPIPFGEIPSLHNKYSTIFDPGFPASHDDPMIFGCIPYFIPIFPLYLYSNPTKIDKWTPKVVMSHERTTVLSGGYWNFSLDILPPFSKSPSLNEAPSHLEDLARSEGAATKTSGHQGHGWLPGEADHGVSMEHPPSHDSVVSNWGYKAIYKWDPRIRDLLTKVVSYSLGWSWKVHQRELWRTTPRILTGMHHQVDRSW